MPYLGNVPSSFNVGTDNINNDAITTAKIADGAILNADVNAAAAIAGTKISPDFGSQNILTTGTATAASLIPTSSTVPTNGLYLPAANTLGISTNSAGRVFIDSSGNVGIGTSSSGGVLRVFGATGNLIIGDSSTNYFDANTQIFRNSAASERMRLDSSGRLGLGTSSPANTLAVAAAGAAGLGGSIKIWNTSARASGGEFSQIGFAPNGDYTGSVIGAYIRAIDPSGNGNNFCDLAIGVGASGSPSERMRIDTSGRLLVGVTSIAASYGTPQVLVVGGDKPLILSNGNNTGTYLEFNTGGANANVEIKADARTGNYPPLLFTTGGTERARIDSNGQLAIGTAGVPNTPRLGVKGNNNLASGQAVIPSTYCGVVISSSSGGSVDNGGALWFDHGDLFSGIAGSRVSTGNWGTDLRFYTHPDSTTNQYTLPERMRITSNGSVFIGTTSAGGVGWTTNGNGTLITQYTNTNDTRSMYTWNSDNAGTNTSAVYIESTGKIYARTTTVQAISSERRLKENITPLDVANAWETIKSVPFYSYNFIGADPSNVLYGPMADEVPDEMRVATSQSDDVGVIHTYDNGMLQARLYVALQAALNKIETLEAKVGTLENA